MEKRSKFFGLIQQYQPNKYQHRSQSVYVASLYRDPLFVSGPQDTDEEILQKADEARAGEVCACGALDPHHTFDAVAGVVPHAAAAQQFKGYTGLAAEVECWTCDHSKRSAVEEPPTEEVDRVSMLRRPPSLRYNESQGRGAGITFASWLEEKHGQAVLKEASKKRKAIAELTRQLARRALAQEKYEEWKQNKWEEERWKQQEELELASNLRENSPHTEAGSSAYDELESTDVNGPSAASMAAARDEIAGWTDEERQMRFQEWCAQKDFLRREAVLREKQLNNAQKASHDAEKKQKRSQAKQAFKQWAHTANERLTQKRQSEKSSKETAAKEEDDLKAAKKVRAAEEYDTWLKAATEKLARDCSEALRKKEELEREKQQRRDRVRETRQEQEQALEAHFKAIVDERLLLANKRKQEEKNAHRTNWQKKPNPLAYATLPRPKNVFR